MTELTDGQRRALEAVTEIADEHSFEKPYPWGYYAKLSNRTDAYDGLVHRSAGLALWRRGLVDHDPGTGLRVVFVTINDAGRKALAASRT